MGLGESEEESSGSESVSHKKRKRENMELMQERKKWKGQGGQETRLCNLYLMGKCPRDDAECLFSHEVDVPQVWELCKFYVYERCVKKDKCLYLHKGFPCKFYHLGLDCAADHDSCKFSHEPLNDTTRGLLLKHVETAPKELLGDFPRLTRHEAESAMWNAEIKNSSGAWSPQGGNKAKGSRWDQVDPVVAAKMAAFALERRLGSPKGSPAFRPGQGSPGFGPGHVSPGFGPGKGSPGFEPGLPWRGGQSILGSPPKNAPRKPAGLMDVKLNENVIKQFLSDQRYSDEDRDVNDSDNQYNSRDCWDPDNGGDETPEITPPVSPAGNLEINELPDEETPQSQLKLHQQIQQKHKEDGNTSADTPELSVDTSKDDYYSEDDQDNNIVKSVLSNLETAKRSPHRENKPISLPPELSSMVASISQNKPGILQDRNSPSQDAKSGKKVEKKDPRLHKVDPRKERLARKEEEERLEREKDQRILDLDLGSVFGDLELPPLLPSPKQTEEERFITNKLGLPFKPHIYHVAKEIDASFNSHAPMEWVLVPVEVPVRDYTYVKHHFTPIQIDLDPRLRPLLKQSSAKLKDLPLPNIPLTTKSDPRLKGRPDPRRKANNDGRRSSEDSEGNRVYNPAKELGKDRGAPPNKPPGLSQDKGQTYSPSDHYKEDQYPYQEDFDNADQMGYGHPMDPMIFPPAQDPNYHSHQFNMGVLKGMMHNEVGGMDPRMMNNFGRGGGRGFPPRFDMAGRGFPPGPPGGGNRGQWTPRFGRGDMRGASHNQNRSKDPRIKS